MCIMSIGRKNQLLHANGAKPCGGIEHNNTAACNWRDTIKRCNTIPPMEWPMTMGILPVWR